MFSLFQAPSRSCQGVSRRDFLRVGALTGMGLGLPQLLASQKVAAAQGKKVKDVNCILIWTLGGTSHHDT
jgi:TAT (twin-arginine translocation) pathway signal sequence